MEEAIAVSSLAIRGVHSLSGPVIGAVAAAASLWFATQLAATLRRSPAAADPAPIVAPAPPPTAPAAPSRPVYDAATLVARNMFCATCTATPPPGDPPPPPGGRRFTARLIATSVESPTRGAATLSDPVTGAAGWFPIGAVAPGGAIVAAVRTTAIDVRFPDGAIETVALDGLAGPLPPPPPPAAATGGLDDRIRSLGDDRWEVERSLVAELVGGGATAQVKGVRLIPVAAAGKLTGIKVAMARTGSLARSLGLEPGDVIAAVDGKPVDAAGLMALYGQLDQLSTVALTVDRGGATRTLTYSLR